MNVRNQLLKAGVTTVMLLGLSTVALAEEQEKTRNCLPMSRIDRIAVIDDHTLRFHMKGGTDYINRLPYPCRGLKSNAFIHETSLQKYCDLDTITKYNTTIGMRMGSCPLGDFEPYTEPGKETE